MAVQRATLLAIPTEIRLQIYGYLLDDGGYAYIPVRNLPAIQYNKIKARITRSRYLVQERAIRRHCYETTYGVGTEATGFHSAPAAAAAATATTTNNTCRPYRFYTSIMGVSRLTYAEASHLLYGRHAFDFGHDTEAIVPFLQDRTPATLPLVRSLSLYKHGPTAFPCGGGEADRADWRNACRFLASTPGVAVRRLRIVVEGGQPHAPWDGPQRFSAADLELLAGIRHESLEWAAELARVPGIQELDLVADLSYCAPPKSGAAIVFVALSASIETGLAEYLRKLLQIERRL